jgi:hypothetical protein
MGPVEASIGLALQQGEAVMARQVWTLVLATFTAAAFYVASGRLLVAGAGAVVVVVVFRLVTHRSVYTFHVRAVPAGRPRAPRIIEPPERLHGHASCGPYYALVDSDGDLRVGDLLGDDEEDYVALDPRTLPIGLDARKAIVERRLLLARVTPRGVVTQAYFETEARSEPDERYFDAELGWSIEAFEPIDRVLGPQARELVAAITEAEKTLAVSGPVASVYDDAIQAQYADDNWLAERQLHAAAEALDVVGANVDFWVDGFGGYGVEMLALAARDLIGTVPGWTLDAYDTLVYPWRVAFGRPLHPGDEAVAR